MLSQQNVSTLDATERALRALEQLRDQFSSQDRYESEFFCADSGEYFEDELRERKAFLQSHGTQLVSIGVTLSVSSSIETRTHEEDGWEDFSFTELAAEPKEIAWIEYKPEVTSDDAFARFLSTLRTFKLSPEVSAEFSLRLARQFEGLTIRFADSMPSAIKDSSLLHAEKYRKDAEQGAIRSASCTESLIIEWFRKKDSTAACQNNCDEERRAARESLQIVAPLIEKLPFSCGAFVLIDTPILLREIVTAIQTEGLERYYERRNGSMWSLTSRSS